MSPLDKLSENLQFIISPTDEDDFEGYLKACNCISNKVQSSWTESQAESFANELDSFAQEIDAALSQTDLLSEPPRPSQVLSEYLENLQVFVSECEGENNVTLEF